jgi:predicted nucleic acid-binding protein
VFTGAGIGSFTRRKVSRRRNAKHLGGPLDSVGRARVTNDALLCSSAFRRHLTLLSTNRRDFDRIAEFCP